MKLKNLTLPILLLFIIFYNCEKDKNNTHYVPSGTDVIASYETATSNYLESIPEEYIKKARNTLHIAYQHTSHGTHVSYGMFGLQDFKSGYEILFGITNNNPTENKLDFRDYAMSSYAADGETATDLSADETGFIQATRNYLDDPDNAEINVVMWSWCNIAGHLVEQNYLPGMQTLINEYGEGGSKIGDGANQRSVPVTFIFMTGHANANSNLGEREPKSQADTIINYCKAYGYYCLDYFGIDSHCMNNNFWEDAGDNGNSDLYGGNFFEDWQDSHTLGVDYYENKTSPGGSVSYGQHNTQHITANRKAFAMWNILARIAGWDGK